MVIVKLVSPVPLIVHVAEVHMNTGKSLQINLKYYIPQPNNKAALVAEWLEHSSFRVMVVCSNPISDLVLISKY